MKARCKVCHHLQDDHIGNSGLCVSPRCVCWRFVEDGVDRENVVSQEKQLIEKEDRSDTISDELIIEQELKVWASVLRLYLEEHNQQAAMFAIREILSIISNVCFSYNLWCMEVEK